MKITMLGTGTSQGIPVIACDCEVCTSTDPRDKRLRVALLLTIDDEQIVIDAGPDFRQQMLRAQVQAIEGILLTHEHNDHIIGIDDVRSFIFRTGKAMPIYCEERVSQDLQRRFAYAFAANPYPGAPRFELQHIQEGDHFSIGKFNIEAIRIMHGRLPILGYRIGSFAYLTDIKTISPDAIAQLTGLDTLIISALHQMEHHSHANLQEALALIEQIQPKRAFLTHISHRMGLQAEVEKNLPAHVSFAYDGLELDI